MASVHEVTQQQAAFEQAVKSGADVSILVDDSLHRCKAAAAELHSRLLTEEYTVGDCFIGEFAGIDQRIDAIESHTDIVIPAVLKRFWKTVGGLQFVDLKGYTHVEYWESRKITGPHSYCDGVWVDACDDGWLEYTMGCFDAYPKDSAEAEFCYPFAPDGYHKDDISGGLPYGLSGDDWMPEVVNFDWTGYRRPDSSVSKRVDFLGYLRTSILECAGFPGLLGHPGFEEMRRKLVSGLPVF